MSAPTSTQTLSQPAPVREHATIDTSLRKAAKRRKGVRSVGFHAFMVICTIVVMAIVASVLGLLTGAGRVVTG